MRRVKAFLTALVLFLLTVGGCHLYIRDKAVIEDRASFGTFPSEEKGKLRVALKENLSEQGFPVFGSSEFQHGTDTPYHPAQVFAGSDFEPMLIGAGYYQSLSHAVTLASIEQDMKIRKAVLILSPQWFRKTGVVDQAYASRFSETHYAAAMANGALSDETKQYISDRTQKLLGVDEKTQKRVRRYDEVFWKKTGGWLESVRLQGWSTFLHEKELFETMLLGRSKELRAAQERRVAGETAARNGEDAAQSGEDTAQSSGNTMQSGETAAQSGGGAAQSGENAAQNYPAAPEWNALLALAEEQGEVHNQNPFYMNDDYYKRLEPHLPAKKGMNSDAVKGYQTGPEFDDLACFLQVCRELDIEPMLVIVPVNGYYYDFTGFPKEARQKYYEKVRGVAGEYGARIADFSDQEYTKYFFEDRVHLGKKGWVMVNESIYEFYKEA